MRGRRGKIKAQAAWAETWNKRFGNTVKEEEIQPGFRFVFYTGDFRLDEIWYEVIEQQWDWRTHENLWVVWNEKTEDWEIWDVESICRVGHKKES